MIALRRRDLIAALLVALVATALLSVPRFDRLRGLDLDVLTWLRWSAFGPRHDPARSPTVVVALDEETYNTPPFSRTPTATWTREMAKVLTAIVDGGAKVIGLDIIFPNSIEQSEIRFGEETLGERLRGFDREFLRAIAVAARAGKLVLGHVQHQAYPIRPADGQRVAVGHEQNMRPLNFHTDRDDVVRRMPLTFTVDGAEVPAMAVELAARASASKLEPLGPGRYALAGKPITVDRSNRFTLNFEGGADAIPTYSLADLRACADQARADFFRKHFEGRVVLVGAVLDLEDRKVATNRLATGIEAARADRCALKPPAAQPKFARDSIAGVYIHATAVNNLLEGDALVEAPGAWRWLAVAGLTLLVALAALLWSPSVAAAVLIGILALWVCGSVFAFARGVVLPVTEAAAAGLAGLFAMVAYRFGVVDRDKRLLRQSFALYLPPSVIDAMLASNKPPVLGGEARNLTIYFSDVASFSTLAENMDPTDLVSLMNVYLSEMTDIIEAHGGFVDKYIGDAIVAVFGAPLDDPSHAPRAVRAALACQARLGEMNRQGTPAFRGSRLEQRIGLNSGMALVGNIGSRRRFNYTAMGDTVNVAARLESANKSYGTAIIASAETAALTGDAIVWRELDAIRVVGIARPVPIFEPLAERGQEAPAQAGIRAAYARALSCWRARDFAGAATACESIAKDDQPAARLLRRAKTHLAQPPGPGWEAVNELEEK
jgi:adenylate cyclase